MFCFVKSNTLRLILISLFLTYSYAQNKNLTSPEIKTYFSKQDSSKQFVLYNHQAKIENKNVAKQTLTISADFEMDVLIVFNEEDIDTFLFYDSTVYEVQIPKGKYNFLVSKFESKHILQLYFKENILLNTNTFIEISQKEISRQNKYAFYREDNSKLRLNIAELTFLFPEKKIGRDGFIGFGYYIGLDSSQFNIHYNILPDFLKKEWAFQGRIKHNINLYLLNGVLWDFGFDTLITNDISNWAFADFQYFFEDSILKKNKTVQIGPKNPGNYHAWVDSFLREPYKLRIFQDESTSNLLYHSKFSTFVNAQQFYNNQYKTSQKRIFKDKVEHYISPSNYENPIISTNNNYVGCGIPPVFWNGRFKNKRDSIKLSAPFDFLSRDFLFVSQSNDVINQSPFDYYIYQNGSEIKRGKIGQIMAIYLGVGALFDTLDYAVDPDKYRYSITNEKVEVAGIAGGVRVDADFDLRLEDKSPPYMDFFQISEDNIITNVLRGKEDAKISIRAYDDVAIKDVSFQLESFETFERIDLEVTKNPPYYEADLPFLNDDSYSLYLSISDSSDNKITTFMDPVFLVDKTTSLNESIVPVKDFEITSIYPNPFNSRIKIKVNLDNKNYKKSKIEIYNILGKKIKSFENKFIKPGITTIIWDGTNNQNSDVASGVYFIYLKISTKFVTKKCVIIR
ncbi:MAG: T9SS C-terminal target domain-containing protein [Calditrichaeota bacterium]|nr:MAG: T9SS C-terminal target domain-containing protein [Calditrichota bacterium]MBL1208033.1 T9SS C-terminal target domain-containing protein [Calditrichota bacterium]NOG47868.1 T9SS type A sorting domain-containing protein [Calditrichota bacterium]